MSLLAAVLAMAPMPSPYNGLSTADQPISMTVSAWGKVYLEWRIDPDGTIAVTEMDPPNVMRYGPYKLITRTAPAMPSRYRTIRAMLKSARKRANTELDCKNPATDQDSGTVSWGGIKLDYYAGCYEESTRAIVRELRTADKLVSDWTRSAPITVTRIVAPAR